MKKIYTNPWILAIGTVLLLIILHAAISIKTGILPIKRTLRPARDLAFFPVVLLTEHDLQIYCFLAKHGPLDYNRCLAPPAPPTHLSLPDGPPPWFEKGMVILSFILMFIMYVALFKIISKGTQKIYELKHKQNRHYSQ
ncbi:MAG: hypothetical protein GW939_01140 [Candidatus Magasanikbacteria bacterium]|uniref:Uncharacterized protein n=1 Tax=Candidatus Magasanikbacteria bacterium CG10_big_fil_rev_8_21_14_0_10_38_6 TaxID=1974647 RepID=A0A2M6P2J1_9BACT|nr:hypothetical protein [Candidatus Magasanikbacteria bacterium]NCS72195.1 hypothetical protein [Candidatus Magasanikbacteria bacterium]PIR77650.1 MAG: hypothetical protein COU30_01295 [Candidatus Magasanikbacteria bacterium CG10_big_fil_rev_8_21_14_0_10_38_6]